MSYLTHLRKPSSHRYLFVLLEHSKVSERHLQQVSSCRGTCSFLYLHGTAPLSCDQGHRILLCDVPASGLTLGWIPGGTSTLDCGAYSSDRAAFYLAAAHFHHLQLFSIQSHKQPHYHPLYSVQLIWSYHCRPQNSRGCRE